MKLEEEIQYGIRAFPKTQEIFTGEPATSFFANPQRATWYGTAVNPYYGAFCVVQEGEGLGDLVGEFLRITYKQDREISLYCVAETPDIEVPIGLQRRAWNQIERLSLDEILVYMQVIY